jgi:polyhydroxyalkanoate synthesis repressor PhaR
MQPNSGEKLVCQEIIVQCNNSGVRSATSAKMKTKMIKKYGNRRLYDSGLSEYITLEQLAEQVRQGADVRVVDASTGEDLTHATLAQILFESRGAARLLSPTVLAQLIRLDQDALAEVLGRYFVFALEWYTASKQGIQSLNPLGSALGLALNPAEALVRMMAVIPGLNSVPPRGPTPWPAEIVANATVRSGQGADPRLHAPAQSTPPAHEHARAEVVALDADLGVEAVSPTATHAQLEALRAQLDALKASVAAMRANDRQSGAPRTKSTRTGPVKTKTK